ncbi:MAG: hypothetical protein ACXW31_00990 [Thermoanaerobaculia bacterium]
MNSVQFLSILSPVPAVGGGVALVCLAWGLYRRGLGVTLAALSGLVFVGLIAVPVFLSAERHDAAMAAMIGLEAVAVVALVSLFCWYTTRRYPAFSAIAALVLGLLASVLVVRATAM